MARARARKRLELQRRSPQRRGSRDTVETIFEATARILQGEGREALNTNRIAEKAGVSIGALYGYFPNKDAILLAMARRELDAMRDRVALAMRETDEPDPVRRIVRALIKGYGARGKVRRILMETLFAHGGSEEMARPVSEVAALLVERAGALFPQGFVLPSEIGMYVLTRAVDSVVRTATYENVRFLAAPAFEDEIVRLVRGFLRQT